MVVSAAPKSAGEYAADARRYDAQRADAESAGDGLAADLLRRATRLDALALYDDDLGLTELAASRRHRAYLDRRAAGAVQLAPPSRRPAAEVSR